MLQYTFVGYWESLTKDDYENQIENDSEMQKENLTNWILKRLKITKN